MYKELHSSEWRKIGGAHRQVALEVAGDSPADELTTQSD